MTGMIMELKPKEGLYQDLEIHDIKFLKDGFRIEWDSESLGYGSVEVYKDSATLDRVIDTECMSKEFIQALFMKMIDSCQIK